MHHLAAVHPEFVGWPLGSSSSPHTRQQRGASHKHTDRKRLRTQDKAAASLSFIFLFLITHHFGELIDVLD